MKSAKALPLTLAAAVASVSLALTGCSNAAAGTSESNAESQGAEDSAVVQQQGALLGGTVEEAEAAIKKAEAELGGSVIGLEFNDDRAEWELTVRTGTNETELHLSRDAETVIETGKPEPIEHDDLALLDSANVSLTDALHKTFASTEGTVEEISLEDDNDVPSWKVAYVPIGSTSEKEVVHKAG